MKYPTKFIDLHHKWYKNQKSYSILKLEEAELWADFGPQNVPDSAKSDMKGSVS